LLALLGIYEIKPDKLEKDQNKKKNSLMRFSLSDADSYCWVHAQNLMLIYTNELSEGDKIKLIEFVTNDLTNSRCSHLSIYDSQTTKQLIIQHCILNFTSGFAEKKVVNICLAHCKD
jgi:hypothetical protein